MILDSAWDWCVGWWEEGEVEEADGIMQSGFGA